MNAALPLICLANKITLQSRMLNKTLIIALYGVNYRYIIAPTNGRILYSISHKLRWSSSSDH